MTETVDRRVTHNDLRTLCLKCEKCGAEIAMDLRNRRQVDRFKAKPKDQERSFLCPFCEERLDPELRAAVDAFSEFLYYMDHAKQPAVFRLQERGEEKA